VEEEEEKRVVGVVEEGMQKRDEVCVVWKADKVRTYTWYSRN